MMKILRRLLFNILRKHKETFPKILSVEFTSACNAKCIMCPQPEMDRKKENMSNEILEKVINDCVGKSLKKINLFWQNSSGNSFEFFLCLFCHHRWISNNCAIQAGMYIISRFITLKVSYYFHYQIFCIINIFI